MSIIQTRYNFRLVGKTKLFLTGNLYGYLDGDNKNLTQPEKRREIFLGCTQFTKLFYVY